LPASLAGSLDLIPELLNVSRANATVKTYHLGFIRWKKWASINGMSSVDILPVKPFFVAINLSSLVQSCRTVSPVTQAFASLQWAHNLIGQLSPTDTYLVKNILEGAKRKLATPTVKKEPITPELLSLMYNSNYKENDLFSQRTICACLLAYAGFLRVSELLQITFEAAYICIVIPNSKTDIYRDGNSVVIVRTDSNLCRDNNLELYLVWGNILAILMNLFFVI
jgi:hypothetical protein